MRDTPENLYLGKITPNEQDVTSGSVLADAMDRAEQCEEKLTARLEVGGENPAAPAPQCGKGFRLGMRTAMESLDEDDGSLTMYREER